ncbi:helix-turn-helix transcriptional regulator [Nocardia sp. CDC159]|uniref:Helix-turn-helix transcriptional regulator n=1 Tax=Nocardia pulmonis TaxID=2951408 RepID=A0A9X2E8Y3_9NOCA|nr:MULTISPECIES: helix-turn-helix transcriptional regulator [Nocardia]MCM6775805.1 helix-turn-helix transcriptional regulator [Nocardia pulmonis]MCM6788219.1 helix-turn-helix transcriptional regulator [Nocardia sp. CDC159]
MNGVSEGAKGLPDPRLRPFVGGYDGYRLRGFAPGHHIGMPTTALTVIVTIDEPLEVPVAAHPDQPGGTWDTLASGLAVRPSVIAHRGYQHGIQLAVTPLGSRALFGVPVAELGAWMVDLADLLGPDAAELRERISATPDWTGRFAVLDKILLRRLGEVRMDPTLHHAWRRLIDPVRAPRVGEVAEEIGWSRRHLGSRFAAEFGITPKDAARLARFETSHRLLRRPGVRIADAAAASGYYDQAHMAREWRELAGMPPSRWLASEEFPFIQDQAGYPLPCSTA